MRRTRARSFFRSFCACNRNAGRDPEPRCPHAPGPRCPLKDRHRGECLLWWRLRHSATRVNNHRTTSAKDGVHAAASGLVKRTAGPDDSVPLFRESTSVVGPVATALRAALGKHASGPSHSSKHHGRACRGRPVRNVSLKAFLPLPCPRPEGDIIDR